MAQKPATDAAAATIDDLADQIATLKNDLATLTKSLGDYGKGKQAEVTQQALDSAHALADRTKQQALHAQSQTEEFVRTQPATALGIAAGIGFLVGMITARK